MVQLGRKQSSVSLHTGICGQPGAGHGPNWNPKMPLLLLPPGYQMLDNGSVPGIMTELLMVGTDISPARRTSSTLLCS